LYGLLGGVMIAGLKLIEYRFLVVEHSLEIYGGIVALVKDLKMLLADAWRCQAPPELEHRPKRSR
jgi:hypothetical protein